MSKYILFAALIPALAVFAQVEPLEPAPGIIFNEGTSCSISWSKDVTGQWTTMNIELMTGANDAMVHLTTVATLDGTTQTSYSYTCPSVSPNSAIYFYQFSSPAAPQNLTWTGRFAIADASGNTVDPTEEKNGIKYGTGALTNPSSASAAPTYLNGAAVSTTAAASGDSNSASSTAVQTVISTSATGALTETGSLQTSVVRSTGAAGSTAHASGSATDSAASSQGTTSGASTLVFDFKTLSLQALAGLAGTALVFTTMF